MAEEEQEKKKRGIVRRILKWIGLGLLTLLLVAALFFQAPWKVTALLIIILLACTALPRPARKWFWLSVAVIIATLIIWVFLPDRNGDWRRYTFDDELAALKAKYAAPDEKNAATIYNQLLETYDANDIEPLFGPNNSYDILVSGPWSSRDYPELAEWLRQQEGTIAKLLEASKKEKCAFPINADPISLGWTMDRLVPMKQLATLLVCAANNDFAEGRIEQTLEKSIVLLQMAKHLCQQPTLIEMLVGIALEALAIEQFKRSVVTGDVTEVQLNVIEEALAGIRHDWSSKLARFFEYEKLFIKNFWGMFYETNSKGKVRLGRNLMKTLWAQCPEELPPPTYWDKRLGKITFIKSWFYMPSTPQRMGEIVDDSFEALYAMAEPDFNWQKKPEEPEKFSLTSLKFNFRFMSEMMVSIMEPSYYGVHDIYLRLIADNRGGRLLVALRRYKDKTGQWPERLEDIKTPAQPEIFIDPFNGGSFVYKLTEENFTLYSKGKNNIDEDGKRDRWGEEKTGADDWLIWPRNGDKTAKENNDGEQ